MEASRGTPSPAEGKEKKRGGAQEEEEEEEGEVYQDAEMELALQEGEPAPTTVRA